MRARQQGIRNAVRFLLSENKTAYSQKFPDACADDVAQEFFLQLMKSHGFKYVQNPTAWVFACCDNIAKRMLIGESATLPLLVSENYSVSEDLVETEILNDQAKRVFDALGDDCTKKIFYLYYWEGYNLREIAQLLSLNISTIKQRHARGIKKIKNLL